MAKQEKQPRSTQELHKQLVQSAFLIFSTLIALVAIAMAWFVNNTRVTGSGMQIESGGSRFELATAGSKEGAYDKYFGDLQTGDIKNIDGVIYHATGGTNTSISWFVSPEGNNANNVAEGGSLQPNTGGSLSFSVLPLVDDLGTMQFTLEVTPYVDATVEQEGAVCIPGKDSEGNPKNYYYVPLASDKTADRLLKGHLLFFAGNKDGYTGQLQSGKAFNDNGGITFTGNKTKGGHADYTFYWVWPGLMEQFVDTNKDKSLFTPGSATQTAVLATMKDTPGLYFSEPNGAIPENIPPIKADMSTLDLNICSGYYNNGDEIIGSTVRYVRLELTATESTTQG